VKIYASQKSKRNDYISRERWLIELILKT
jgi:hypothetical protein